MTISQYIGLLIINDTGIIDIIIIINQCPQFNKK